MAIGKVQESTGSVQFKHYIGIGAYYVKGINPTKEAMSSFFEREIENAPEYLSKQVNKFNEEVDALRLNFLLMADPTQNEKEEISLKTSMSLFLRNEYNYNSTKTKVQVVDKYGRFAWANVEEAREHKIPTYHNGPADISSDYRPAYVGEEDLNKFIRAYLGIKNPVKFVNKKKVPMTDAELAECAVCLEHIPEYFKGNLKELKDTFGLLPNNRVKICTGVRRDDSGREYQNMFTREFVNFNSNNYNYIASKVNEVKNSGAYSTTEFEFVPLHEYVVKATNFETKGTNSDLPFDAPSESPWTV